MKTSDFYYHLPEGLIAQRPLEKRDASRLMILNRDRQTITHGQFSDLLSLVRPGDGLVMNYSRVIPARIIGKKRYTNGRVECLLLKEVGLNQWEALVKPAKRLRTGSEINFGNGVLTGTVVNELPDGLRTIEFKSSMPLMDAFETLGQMPLPPYIHEVLEDKERYQTVYSRENGSAAAPTAGLHFTHDLLRQLEDKGIRLIPITLHVGLGTFRPVQSELIHQHKMHEEYYEISRESAEAINQVKESGNRIIAVGTTSCRTLESAASKQQVLSAGNGWTDLYITPGYSFRLVDVLITNFHLPESTLLMLVSAFAGYELAMSAYREAVESSYRFFSFGDAMWIE